ncbi:hypothetical protein ACWDNT_27490 [Streptomyces sp. NPDC000963]|uniref:hypothetical protein n=1 Tax=Streptomyces sp. NPDC007872 TaxID=3364782 RepID=UPI0036A829A7
MTFHVTLQFQPPDGPTVTSLWERQETADGKFEEWVYTHSAHPTARITLVEESAGVRRVLSEWTRDSGTIRHTA